MRSNGRCMLGILDDQESASLARKEFAENSLHMTNRLLSNNTAQRPRRAGDDQLFR